MIVWKGMISVLFSSLTYIKNQSYNLKTMLVYIQTLFGNMFSIIQESHSSLEWKMYLKYGIGFSLMITHFNFVWRLLENNYVPVIVMTFGSDSFILFFIFVYSIFKKKMKAYKCIGYCPQFDALFDELTAREHLLFYARVKGVKQKDEKQVIWNV